MKEIIIEENISLPRVEYDNNTNILSIYGRLFPETVFDFENPIIQWINNNKNKEIKLLDLTLEYINSSCLKALLDIIKKGNFEKINWNIEKDDETMEDLGIMLKDFFEIKINVNKIKKINSISYKKIQNKNKRKYLNFFKKINNSK